MIAFYYIFQLIAPTFAFLMANGIEREVSEQFDKQISISLKLPLDEKLDATQTADLKNERKNQSSKKSEIKRSVLTEWQNKFDEIYEKKPNTAQHKNEFIENRLKKLNKAIQQEAEQRVKLLLVPVMTEKQINWLKRYVISSLVFPRAAENPEAAIKFFYNGLTENAFNQYLELTPQDDPQQIPDIYIEGGQLSDKYSEYCLKKISPFDVEAAYLGKLSSCCQSLGEEGTEPTIYGITSKNAGFYAVCKKGLLSGEQDKPLGQSLAWRGPGKQMIDDSIESQVDFRKRHSIMLSDFYIVLAHKLITEHGVTRVLTGRGNTPKALMNFMTNCSITPIDYDGYRDSLEQYIIADNKFNFINEYIRNNPESALNASASQYWLSVQVSTEEIYEMIDELYSQHFSKEKFFRLSHFSKEQIILIENRLKAIEAWEERLENNTPVTIQELQTSSISLNMFLRYRKVHIVPFLADKKTGKHLNGRLNIMRILMHRIMKILHYIKQPVTKTMSWSNG